MRFSFFGTNIYISFLFCAVISAMLVFDRTGYLLYLLIVVFLHETGHLFLMWCLDCAPKKVNLYPCAVEITTSFNFDRKNEFYCTLAGPLVNLILFGVFYLNFLIYGNENQLVFALTNLLIGAFNLLPVRGLDGGALLYLSLSPLIGEEKSALVLKIINLLFGIALIFLGVYLIFNQKTNLSVFIIGLYLLIITFLKK